MFAIGPGDQGSIPGRHTPSIVLDAAWHNTQYYKAGIEGKVDQSLAGGCPRGVMVKVMDCGIVVREFVL